MNPIFGVFLSLSLWGDDLLTPLWVLWFVRYLVSSAGQVKILRGKTTCLKCFEKRSLAVEVWNHRRLLPDYLVGRAEVPLVELLAHSNHSVEAVVIAASSTRPRLTKVSPSLCCERWLSCFFGA
jgi:hypothetical protein